MKKNSIFIGLLLLMLLPSKLTIGQNKTVSQSLEQCQQIIDNIDGKAITFQKLLETANTILPQIEKQDAKSLCQAYYFLGVGYYNTLKFDSAAYYFEQCYSTSIPAREGDKGAYAVGSLVHVYNYLGMPDKSDSSALVLASILDTISSPKAKSIGYYTLGIYNVKFKAFLNKGLGDLIQGINYMKPVADTAKTSKPKLYYAAMGIEISDVYYALNNNLKSIAYLDEVKPYAILAPNTHMSILCRYVKNYAALNKIDEALQYLKMMDTLAKDVPNASSEGVTSNIEVASYYLRVHQFPKALSYLEKASNIAHSSKGKMLMAQTDAALGEYYYKTNEYAKAKNYLNNSVDAIYNFNKETYCNIRSWLLDIALDQNDVAEAKKQKALFQSASDSLNSEKVTKNLAEMEAIYQNKEKQNQISVQKAKISFVNKQLYWALAGVLLLIGLAVILFNFYRSKNKHAQELALLNNELDTANKTKAKLFSIISHDLRSPISQVYQYLNMLQLNPDKLDQEQKLRLSNQIQNATASLLETMEELLVWSKTQMTEIKASIANTEIKEVLDESIQLLQLNIDAKKLKVLNHIPEKKVIKTDAYFLQTIVRNLLANAIKASPVNAEINITMIDDTLSIQNKGGHVSQEQYQQIVHSDETDVSLSGLGLKLINDLSKTLNIEVQFEADPADETKVSLQFK